MKKIFTRIVLLFFLLKIGTSLSGQTIVPNGSFETWIDGGKYEDPEFWDTPNKEISSILIFGKTVVTKSTDCEAGDFSAKLETKSIFILSKSVPGCVTLGNLTINTGNQTYTLTGGIPINDNPAHLHGFYKYFPQGGDSCLIAIGLFKTVGEVVDTIGRGYLSTHATIPDWTPFSIWINYDTMEIPELMDIVALSSAEENGTAGTILFVDEFTLDYTGSIEDQNPNEGIEIYQDKETKRILLFFDFMVPQQVSAALYNMSGHIVNTTGITRIQKQKMEVGYGNLSQGIYVLEIIHDNQKLIKKFFLDF